MSKVKGFFSPLKKFSVSACGGYFGNTCFSICSSGKIITLYEPRIEASAVRVALEIYREGYKTLEATISLLPTPLQIWHQCRNLDNNMVSL